MPTVMPGVISRSIEFKGAHTALQGSRGHTHNSQDFWGLASQREGSRATGGGEEGRDTPSDPSAWRDWRTSPSAGIMPAPAGRISPIAGQLNQTLSP